MKEFEIKLEKIILFARHGVYEHERRNGNDFEITLSVKFPALDDDSIMEDDLGNTISYVSLWDIIVEEMNNTRNLLETVAASIVNRIYEAHPYATLIECKITKMRPPIPNFNGVATVCFRREADNDL